MTLVEAQDCLVSAMIAAGARSGWQRIFADVEILEFSDGYDVDSVTFTIVRGSDGAVTDPPFSITSAVRQKIVALYRAMADETGSEVGGFELTIEASGAYRFTFNHDQPKRLNGIWDRARQEYIDNYLLHYQREIGER